MALDVGRKNIGIATCDETRTITSPRQIINRKSNLKDFTKIKEFFDQNQIKAIIIGWPLNMDESASEMSQFVENFAKNLDQFLEKQIPIQLFDERLSSFSARNFNNAELSRKKGASYDDIAASLILESFLNS